MESSPLISPRRLLAAALAMGVCSGPLQALDLRASLGTTVEHTDNGLKSRSGDKRSELEQRAWLAVGAHHEGAAVKTDLGYGLSRTWYKHHTQRRDTTAEGDGSLHWKVLDERLFVDVSHSRRKVLRDSSEVELRRNQEERDITTVAPAWVWRLGPVDDLTFRASWTDVNYDKRDDRDSQRYGGNVTWTHQLSEVDRVLATASTTKVDYRNSLAPNYRHDSLSVGYSSQLARLNYTVQLGANRASREGGRKNVNGMLVDIDARYVSGFNSLSLTARRSISDSSLANGNQVLEGFYSHDSSRNQVDVIEATRVMLSWSSTALCDRCTLRLAGFAERESYEEQPDDNTQYGAEGQFHYELTRTSRVGLLYRHRKLRYRGDNPRANYSTDQVQLSLDQQLGQNLRGGIFLGWEERDSRRSGHGYSVFSGGVTLSWQFL